MDKDKKISKSTYNLFMVALPCNVYLNKVLLINGKKFTERQIDVIAGIISGRTSKKIASILSISPKTVDTHIYNIMLELQCGSRNNIIDFIEKSNEYLFLKNHYSYLLKRQAFEEKLKNIKSLLKDKFIKVYLLIDFQKESSNLADQLIIDFEKIGVEVLVHDYKNIKDILKEHDKKYKSN